MKPTVGLRSTGPISSLTARVRERLLDQSHRIDLTAPGAREAVRDLVWQLIEEEEAQSPVGFYPPSAKDAALERVLLTVFGFGLLDPLLHDSQVTEIMINGPEHVFVERGSVFQPALDARGEPLRFESLPELLYLIERIVSPLNRKVDESDPIVDARLPDGSRVNVVLRPIALNGPIVTIRKFPRNPFSLADLVRLGTLPPGQCGEPSRQVPRRWDAAPLRWRYSPHPRSSV